MHTLDAGRGPDLHRALRLKPGDRGRPGRARRRDHAHRAHCGPAIQARHPIRHRPYSAAPRGRARPAQTLAPLRKRAATWAWQSRSENRIRISYILQWSRWPIATRSLQRSRAIRNGSKRAETMRKAAPCHIEANTILTPTAFSAARLGRIAEIARPQSTEMFSAFDTTRRR